MTIETRLIFGVRTSGAVSLTVTADGQLPQQPPDLRIKTSESEKDIEISCSNNTWVTTLGAGDHIVYMPTPGDRWFQNPLTFTLSAPATIVSYTGTPRVLRTWTATVGTASDPKNPWPPPLAINADTDPGWLSSTLATMVSEIETDRSAPPYVPPADTAKPDPDR